jgi:hypothetical protein
MAQDSGQKRQILSALDYSMGSLHNLKKSLTAYGEKQSDIQWAVGGLFATLAAFLLSTMHEVIYHSANAEDNDAKTDMLEIQRRLNNFIDDMVASHD